MEVLGPRWTGAVERRERQQFLLSEQKLAQQMVNEARRECQRIDGEMARSIGARNELASLGSVLAGADKLKEELQELEREAQKAGLKRNLQGQLEEVDSEIGRMATRLEELEKVEFELQETREKAESVHHELHDAQGEEDRLRTLWVQDKQEALTKRESLAAQYQDVAEHRKGIKKLGPEGSCPMCRRELGGEFSTVLESLYAQLEEIKFNGKFFRQRVEQLDREPEEYARALERLKTANQAAEQVTQSVSRLESMLAEKSRISRERDDRAKHGDALRKEYESLGVSYDSARHDHVRSELKKLEPLIEKARVLRLTADQAEKLIGDAENGERLLSEKEARAKSVNEEIELLNFDENEYTLARELNETAQENVRGLELQLVSVEAEVRAADVALETVSTKMSERAKRGNLLLELKKELRLNESLDSALKNLRGELNASMRPEISEIASSFLSDLTDGRYSELELDEQYQVVIVEDGVAKPVISGGEEDIANLVLRIAISQMVAERSGHPLSLLVLDEIFGSLDESRRHNVVDLLRRLGDRFPQVVLISHIETVRQGVDRVITVALDQETGTSQLKEDRGGDTIAA